MGRRSVMSEWRWLIPSLALGGLSVGCVMPQRSFQPSHDPDTLNDAVFIHYLATVPVVTVAEGARAVLLIVGSTEQWPTFDQQWDELSRRRAVVSTWRLRPGRILDKATLAYMLRTLCDLPRSLNETLASATGLGDRRYALRTCIDRGLLPYGRPHDPVTGGELLSALTRAQECGTGESNLAPKTP